MKRDPLRCDQNDRPLITRAEMAEWSGLATVTLYVLYRERNTNGHPEPLRVLGGVPYWVEEEWRSWYEGYRRKKRERLTEVAFGGDPDELLGTAEAARVLGFSSRSVIHVYLSTRPGYFPEPDDIELTRGGRLIRRWRRDTLWAFARTRQGGYSRGPMPPVPPRVRQPPYSKHRFIDDARKALLENPTPTARQLGERLGIPHYTASNLLTAARRMRNDSAE